MSSFIVFDKKGAGFIYVRKSGWRRITFLIIGEKDWIWFLKDFSIWCASTWWNRFFHNLDLIGHFVRVFWQESFVSVIPRIWWIISMLQVTFGFFIAQQGIVPMNWWIKDGFDHSGEDHHQCNLLKIWHLDSHESFIINDIIFGLSMRLQKKKAKRKKKEIWKGCKETFFHFKNLLTYLKIRILTLQSHEIFNVTY